MTALAKQHTYRVTLTPCPRCKLQPGSQTWPTSWLNEITNADGFQAVHALICRRPSCSFAEIIGLRAETQATARRSWLRDAIARYPLTFAAAALVNGAVLGATLALR